MTDSTTQKQHVRDLGIAGLRSMVLSDGQPEYRFRQLATWIYGRLIDDFAAMTDLPLSYRQTLSEGWTIQQAQPVSIQSSQLDGTRKYLFQLSDGALVESVLMQYDQRTTLCLSSQVGCPLDCAFCETAKGRFQRNLTAGEILDQVARLQSDAGMSGKKINIVFMGMGEPLLNLDNVVAAIRTLNDPLGHDLGNRRVTVSTSSFPDRIHELADAGVDCSLAVSLNAPNNDKRTQLMPKASRFTIEELMDAARYFMNSGKRRVTLEYVLLKGFNASTADARQLARLVRNQPFKVNLIPYNAGRNDEFESIEEPDIDRFMAPLLSAGITVTVRRSRGRDIDAGCGQLWTQSLTDARS